MSLDSRERASRSNSLLYVFYIITTFFHFSILLFLLFHYLPWHVQPTRGRPRLTPADKMPIDQSWKIYKSRHPHTITLLLIQRLGLEMRDKRTLIQFYFHVQIYYNQREVTISTEWTYLIWITNPLLVLHQPKQLSCV